MKPLTTPQEAVTGDISDLRIRAYRRVRSLYKKGQMPAAVTRLE